MNKTVKIIIIISAVFFAFASSGFTPIITIEPVEEARPAVKFTPKMHSLQAPVAEQAPAVMQAAVRQIPAIETQAPASVNFDSGYFNPLAIPELKAPVPRPPEPVMTKPSNEAVPVFDNSSVLQEAPDPRMYYSDPGKHKDYFVPASEARPPERSLSIPVVDNTIPGHFDMNEYEEDRFFSSNLYTDTAFYNTHVKGDKELSSKEKGSFYDINYRYELFSTSIGGDSLALNVDATYTNSKRAYEKGFTLNHFSLESDTERSRLVFGDAYPDMSRYSFTQGIVGVMACSTWVRYRRARLPGITR